MQKREEIFIKKKYKDFRLLFSNFAFFRLCVFTLFLIISSCKVQPTDLRIFAPAETLVYLEAGNLANMLNALTENETFKNLSADKKDFSALENVQFAVFITGFETSEKTVPDGQAILNFKPRFVAVAETHLWNWQAVSLTENQIGGFVKETYGGETNLEISNKNGGKWFVWTAKDGRKIFALVAGSRIFFGNDETSIEKSLAVRRGEGDNLLKNESFTRAYNSTNKGLAFGYVSPDGIAQIASIAAVSTAIEASEDTAPRDFIARTLPEIVRKSITEIVWTANKTGQGIEDVYRISTGGETSAVLKETIVPAPENQISTAEFLPSDVFSATRYNLRNPQIAWRSLLLAAAKQVDAVSAKILIAFADSIFAPYGVADSEAFLSAIGSEIITARFDAGGEKSAAIVTVENIDAVKKSLSEEINFKKAVEKQGEAEIWKSEDGFLSAAFVADKLILGDSESVLKCLQAKQSGQNFTKTGRFALFSENRAAVAVTFSNDSTSAETVLKILGNLKTGQNASTNYVTETRFDKQGIERKTVSAFGFIGTILEYLGTQD